MTWLGTRMGSNLDKVPDYPTMRDLHPQKADMMNHQIGHWVVWCFRGLVGGKRLCDVHVDGRLPPREQVASAWADFAKMYPNSDPSRVMLCHD